MMASDVNLMRNIKQNESMPLINNTIDSKFQKQKVAKKLHKKKHKLD